MDNSNFQVWFWGWQKKTGGQQKLLWDSTGYKNWFPTILTDGIDGWSKNQHKLFLDICLNQIFFVKFSSCNCIL